MYAVIFKAELRDPDHAYYHAAEQLRKKAIESCGCISFTSCYENDYEISISYWSTMEQIKAWEKDPDHREVQQVAASKWYKSYQVQIVEVLHEYSNLAL